MGGAPTTAFQAAIFDFDGTLVDSEAHYAGIMVEVLGRRGIVVDRVTVQQLCLGRPWQDIQADVQVRWPGIFAGPEELTAQVRAAIDVAARATDGVIGAPIADSVTALERLARLVPACIVTGAAGEQAWRAARRFGFAGQLRFIVGCEDYGAGKPDPAPFLLGAERLGLPPSACLVFEDSPAGVQAAKAAGMTCVQLTATLDDGAARAADGADLVVDSLLDERVWRLLEGG